MIRALRGAAVSALSRARAFIARTIGAIKVLAKVFLIFYRDPTLEAWQGPELPATNLLEPEGGYSPLEPPTDRIRWFVTARG